MHRAYQKGDFFHSELHYHCATAEYIVIFKNWRELASSLAKKTMRCNDTSMYIKVKVTPKTRREVVEWKGKDSLKISVKEPAERGLANARAREIVAREFGVVSGKVRLVSGQRTSSKLFLVDVE